MFHIFSLCPSSLISKNIQSHFRPEKGNLISQNIPKNFKEAVTWKERKLSQEEAYKYKEILVQLDKKNVLINNNVSINGIDQLVRYLNMPNCEIENGISEEFQASNCKKLLNSEEFISNKIDNLSKFVDIPKKAEDLLNLISPFILKSYNFKLIDPYFYKNWISKSKGKTEYNTKEKIEFLTKLCHYLFKNHQELKSVNIEIYGQGFDNDNDRGKHFARFLKDELSKFQIFEDLYEDGRIGINFFGIDKKNNKIKVHDRLFLCDQFSLNLNDGFYSEDDTSNEIFLINDVNRIKKFKEMYSKNTNDFIIEFNFSIEDLFE